METKQVAPGVDLEATCKAFGDAMGQVLLQQLQPEENRSGSLRLSAIGKEDRLIYNKFHGVAGAELKGSTYIKFLYGHVVEELVVTLCRLSGHTVTDQQKECHVAGVKGHMDGRLDGVLFDVKSCSSFGFKKFKYNTLHKSDDFGYIPQLKAYAHSEGDTVYGWLAMDKQNGSLAWLEYDESDTGAPYAAAIKYDVEARVNYLKKLVGSDLLPAVCYAPVEDGKSGNMRLDTGCAYCDYRATCWPNAQAYSYSGGVKYLTKVVREPRVEKELPEGF
jgi:hypothetical protein